MLGNLNKFLQYGLSIKLSVPTYTKVFKLPFFLWLPLPLVLANWRIVVAYLMYVASSSYKFYNGSKFRIWMEPVPVALACIGPVYFPYMHILFQILYIIINISYQLPMDWFSTKCFKLSYKRIRVLLFQGIHIYNGLCCYICSSSEDWSLDGNTSISQAISITEQPEVQTH
jgi:hypothetical protein